MIKLVTPKDMLIKAKKGQYAIAHFNINNLEWIKSILEVAQETKSPVILGASVGAIKYMGGYHTVVGMVNNLMNDLNITVPIALHLDHGQKVEQCIAAIDAGFSSVMFDGSEHDIEENLELTKQVVAYAKKHHVTVEAEVGSIGGEEDGVIGNGELAKVDDCLKMKAVGIDFLAAGINNIHGPYPSNWTGLKLERLQEISQAVNLPLVLHGGSGIDNQQIQMAIKKGINKINVNTELQLAFQKAMRHYIETNQDIKGKGYDPRKLLAPGVLAIKKQAIDLLKEFGSFGQAT